MQRPKSKSNSRSYPVGWVILALSPAILGLGFLFWDPLDHIPFSPTESSPPWFSTNFPESQRQKDELVSLRLTRLTATNEHTIREQTKLVADQIRMPEPLLWCLMFQESRLNHLEGIENDGEVFGIGQFTPFSLYELNHELHRINEDGQKTLVALLGSDVRPIEPRRSDLDHPSSYFNIKTGVTATGMFLQNRKLQLEKIALSHGIQPDPDILWLWASLAYNKGSKGTLSIWNHLQRRGGREAVRRALTDRKEFTRVIKDIPLLQQSFQRVWPEAMSDIYARELRLHAAGIKDCALRTEEGAL